MQTEQVSVTANPFIVPLRAANIFDTIGWTISASVVNLISPQYWKNEFGKGGCYAVFFRGAEESDPFGGLLDKVESGSPGILDTALQGQSTTLSVWYAAKRGLSVPLRSPIVRGTLHFGEKAAPLITIGTYDLQIAVGLYKELDALAKGECH